MRVLSVGGGSGGHVTPVLAVINELKKLDPTLEVVFVCDKAFEAQSRGLMKHADAPVHVQVISAGKLRRYHGIPIWKQLLDLPTVFKNIRDILFITGGFLQSMYVLRRFKPDVVFAKGGYVCLPMGYAAKVLGVPLVIHDSDARPGLTNTLLSRFAQKIATGSPTENYSYPSEKSIYTGVPIDPAFRPFSPEEIREARHDLGIVDLDKPLLVVTGGGLGAKSINEGALAAAPSLLDQGFAVYHIAGKRHFEAVQAKAPQHPDYHVTAFVYKDMARVLGAADIVLSRGSATFLQELAALAKPTIIVPAQHLGDQVKNAAAYQAANAAYILSDDQIRNGDELVKLLAKWKAEKAEAAQMVRRFNDFAKPQAAADVARLVVGASKQGRA